MTLININALYTIKFIILLHCFKKCCSGAWSWCIGKGLEISYFGDRFDSLSHT